MSAAVVLAGNGLPGANVNINSLGQLSVRVDAQGVQYLRLPTGSAQSRALFQALCTSDEEATIAAMSSVDIDLKIPAGPQNLQRLAASIIRREGYFRAVLIQSRGTVQALCSDKCVKAGSHKFLDCRAIVGFCRGACAECVWQSHGSRCDHYV